MDRYHHNITTQTIAKVGAELGFERLSLGQVARRLHVTTPALYRHVANRRQLDQVVAALMLSDFSVADPKDDVRSYLVSLAQSFFKVCRDNPGLECYLMHDFPADPESARIAAEAKSAIQRHGYGAEAAASLAGLTATYAIALAASARGRGTDDDLVEVAPGLALGPVERFTLMILPPIDGLLEMTKPDDSLADIVATATSRLP
ncbi:MAG: TetR family transcriptional regulator [Flaviflexus sp.]|nr:TetR family transcriptional regulator [Flaviflexus sp.]